MLMNIRKYTTKHWTSTELEKAKIKFGEVIDIDVPYTYNLETTEQKETFAKEFLKNIIKEHKGKKIDFQIFTEDLVFMFKFIEYAKEMGYDCYTYNCAFLDDYIKY